MRDYQIKDLPDGRFAVIEAQPKNVAIFEEAFHAEVFLNWLQNAPVEDSTLSVMDEVQAEQPDQEDQQPVEPDWSAAFERIKGGEKVKEVAADMGLPFGTLRAKWANRKRYLVDETEPETTPNLPTELPSTKPVATGADAPVSGRVGAVLARGQKPWTQFDIDAINLAEASGTSIAALAKQLGRIEAECRQKIKQIDAGIQRDLQERLS